MNDVVPAAVVRAPARPARAAGRRRVHGRRGARRAHVDRRASSRPSRPDAVRVTPPSWRPDLARPGRPGRGGRAAARLRPDPVDPARGARWSRADREAALAAFGRACTGRVGPGRGADLPVRRHRPARRSRDPGRRRPPTCGPPGQPAVRRAAVHADEPAGHAARRRSAQRRAGARPTWRSSRSAWSRVRWSTLRRRLGCPVASDRRTPSWRRSTPRSRRSPAGWPACSPARGSRPAGGARGVASTTPTRSRRHASSRRCSGSTSRSRPTRTTCRGTPDGAPG